MASESHSDGAAVCGRKAGAGQDCCCRVAKDIDVQVDIFDADIEPSGPHGIAAQLRKRAPDRRHTHPIAQAGRAAKR
jgi:hypothetical protein